MHWISYLRPIMLYRATSARGTKIEVREHNGARELYLDGYPQTRSRYRQDWAKLLKKIVVGRTLVLGLGGGDVVRLLTGCKITAVELEPEVVRVAEDYFGIKPRANLEIVTEDAKVYLEKNKRQYDVVIVDLYSGDKVPKFVEGQIFLQNVANALTLGGTAIFNYASHGFESMDFSKFETKLNKIFGQVKKIVIWGHTFYVMQKIGK